MHKVIKCYVTDPTSLSIISVKVNDTITKYILFKSVVRGTKECIILIL